MVPNMPGQGENEEVREDTASTGAETGATEASTLPIADAAAPAANQTVEPANPVTGTSADAAPNAAEDSLDAAPEPEAEPPTENTPPASPSDAVHTPETAKKFKRGDLIEGTVQETSPMRILVGLDEETVGVIPTYELERINKRNIEELQVGSKVMVYIVNPRDVNGDVLLSYNRAIEELDWQRAEEFRQSQDVLESRIAGYNKGGLIVRFGRLRGFVPQSQMSAERRRVLEGEANEEQWSKMVNESIFIKVVEVDRQRNRLILSERSASRETREKRKESLIHQLSVGEIRTGRVVSLEDFGAFVDIGGAEGLVHLTELSWHHVTHPREVLQVGEEVKVEVISIDPVAKRIGLSMRRQAPDPWDTIALGYQVGQLVKGKVTKLTKFGAFAEIVDVPEIEGLIHISELSDKRVQHPREAVKEGDVLTLRIVKIDVKNRRLGLSLKQVNSAAFMDMDWGQTDEPNGEDAAE